MALLVIFKHLFAQGYTLLLSLTELARVNTDLNGARMWINNQMSILIATYIVFALDIY